ncbi:Lanthionine biosynthesis cyclase LanC [Alloactinosynnema sp. L-07]|uniref:lanthionine synthetase C family protein n=1 Tax=Alloactinosynnema sp. L-07 TaxID=1653480 RepID=UPI00065EFBBA|nr:lanthionine synthetase C family protein [Alloactinosynnema sp. L-07]CRK57672.1 Lanthionine biosynthesis cyclase LanC [Alloactinosynnema sp. L-07]
MISPAPQALAAADTIADRLADPTLVYRAGMGRHRPQSLAGGAAGIALLHIERARCGHGDPAVAHRWLSAAARDGLSVGHNAGLYFGAPTLAFITNAAADQPGKYARALGELDTNVTALTRSRVHAAHARIDRGERPLLAEFDLIRGLAGLGSHHLHRHPDHEITRTVLDYLVRLTTPPGRSDELPGWWTDVSPNGVSSPDFPGGHANTGMSHGITAVLALLSLALRHGVVVDGHTEAIGRINAWLDAWRQHDDAGSWWPGYLTHAQARAGQVDRPNRQRPSWCYGTPGVARAQQLAGLATGDLPRQRDAATAMLGCLRDTAQLDRLTDSGLCHGVAGVLQTAWRMAADHTDPDLAAELPALTDRLLAHVDTAPDDPEFLDGQAGIALALHTAGTATAPVTTWDACLLLA